ncbi:MAG: hypothetical protein WD767_05105 [Alphaproteobacteria bacterium]
MNWRPFSIDEALTDPKRVFGSPENVVSDPRLDRSSKLEILRRWQSRTRQATGRRDATSDAAALRYRVQWAINHLQQTGKRSI